MVITKEDRACWCCEYYDNMTGYCRNKKHHTHAYDNICDKWLKGKDLREKRTKKTEKGYEKLKLF